MTIRCLTTMLCVLATAGACLAAQFHVAADGQPEGDGSRERPWDLATALSHPQAVQPGDTLWLHGGTYRGTFTSRLSGTADQPILVRQVLGERATLDAASAEGRGTTLAVYGEHTWFRDFEITNSSPHRITQQGGSHPDDLTLNGSIDLYAGQGHKLINLVVHHCSAGPSAWGNARDIEVYGCLVFNNGWEAPDRGHGHAFYWQNKEGTKRLVDNVLFHQFSHGVHFYGSSRAFLNNFHIQGNIAFNNGALSKRTGPTRNLLVGGGRLAENVMVRGNFTYYSRGGANILGYGRGAEGLTVQDNYFAAADSGRALQVNAQRPTITGNTFAGRVDGFTADEHPENTYVSGRPEAVQTFVRPNRYEAGRANVVIYNWDMRDEVEVDLAPANLERGQPFQIRDVQNWFGEPVVTGQYDGRPVPLPMTGLPIAPPLGDAPVRPPHTGPEFAVFVVLPQTAATTEPHP